MVYNVILQKHIKNMIALPLNHVWTLFFYGQLRINLHRVVLLLQIYDSGLEVTRQYSCLLQGTLQTTTNKQYYTMSQKSPSFDLL